jgi:hypothetical protein
MSEQELKEFYAGLAMLGLIVNGDYSLQAIPSLATKLADSMIQLKKEQSND